MAGEPRGNFSRVSFALCALAGAVPGLLAAIILITTGHDAWSILGVFPGVPLGVWIATTVAYRNQWRGVLLIILWVIFAFVVFERWFVRG
jgi:hypothetical protein